MTTQRKVAILGASDKPDRYAYVLMKRLLAQGHEVFPINPALESIEGHKVYPSVESLPPGVDVLTVYMNAGRSDSLADVILASGIPKVVFNPGAENPGLESRLEQKGAEAVEACSLVLLGMNRL
ncbi:MAG TPA: CoA-binding protein [Fibrobacteria bacterium]|nr:CoA-binding protein [Fibrobacteria bacterium]